MHKYHLLNRIYSEGLSHLQKLSECGIMLLLSKMGCAFMSIKTFLKKYVFVFLLFCVQELFMNLIGEYNKTFLAKSFKSGRYIADMLWTLVLYSVVVFTIAFVIFVMYFKEQSLLYSFKKKLLCFAGVTVVYEFIKAVTYAIAKDKTQSVYFILGNIYLFAVQIVIYRLFSEIDTENNEKSLNIGKKQVIAAAVLIVASTVFIIISEHYFKTKSSNEIYQSGMIFLCGFRLAFVTALVQTILFGSLMNEELPEKLTFKSQFILLDGLAGMAAFMFFAKFALPEGMIPGFTGSEGKEGPAKNCFSICSHDTEFKRYVSHKESIVFSKQTTEVYFDGEKVLTYTLYDPSMFEKIEYFKLNYEGIEGEVKKDIAIVYRTSDGKIEYCIFGKNQSKGYDSNVYKDALIRTRKIE